MPALISSLKNLLTPTDEQLMWRVQTRDDAAAFAELVGRWQEPLQRLCARVVGDAHLAEDLTQEIFAKLYARRHAYEPARKFSTWVWRVALNHCYNDCRRTRHRHETRLEPQPGREDASFDDFPADHPCPREAVVATETADAVRAAVSELPENYRCIVILRHYEGLKFREIAEVLDLPEGTVKTRMTEALNDLARRLRGQLELRVAPAPNRRQRPQASFVP
jgi:RNA polymerase sigma-70 factor (ECF subfamily)